MKLYNLTNNDENWKHLYQSIEDKNWDFLVKTIEGINQDKTFWENVGKYQLAEISYCCWYLLDYDVGYAANDFYIEVTKTLSGGYNCYLKRFKKDNDLTSLMGYMISVIAYPFEVSSDRYLEFEEEGRQMLKDAYKNDPGNPLFQYFASNDKKLRNRIRVLARERMNQMFEPCPGLREYFHSILGDR